jgi:hypothetical protein
MQLPIYVSVGVVELVGRINRAISGILTRPTDPGTPRHIQLGFDLLIRFSFSHFGAPRPPRS